MAVDVATALGIYVGIAALLGVAAFCMWFDR